MTDAGAFATDLDAVKAWLTDEAMAFTVRLPSELGMSFSLLPF
jgi:hypothetical protein